jgi:hypothetical protein
MPKQEKVKELKEKMSILEKDSRKQEAICHNMARNIKKLEEKIKKALDDQYGDEDVAKETHHTVYFKPMFATIKKNIEEERKKFKEIQSELKNVLDSLNELVKDN